MEILMPKIKIGHIWQSFDLSTPGNVIFEDKDGDRCEITKQEFYKLIYDFFFVRPY